MDKIVVQPFIYYSGHLEIPTDAYDISASELLFGKHLISISYTALRHIRNDPRDCNVF